MGDGGNQTSPSTRWPVNLYRFSVMDECISSCVRTPRPYGPGARNSARALPTACDAAGHGQGTSGTWTDRRDAESGRCNGLNRPSRPRISSLLTHSFMATSIHADTSWQPPPTAQSGPRHSMSGSRRRALSIRRDQQSNRPPSPTSPLEVNVTLPSDAHCALVGFSFVKTSWGLRQRGSTPFAASS